MKNRNVLLCALGIVPLLFACGKNTMTPKKTIDAVAKTLDEQVYELPNDDCWLISKRYELSEFADIEALKEYTLTLVPKGFEETKDWYETTITSGETEYNHDYTNKITDLKYQVVQKVTTPESYYQLWITTSPAD